MIFIQQFHRDLMGEIVFKVAKIDLAINFELIKPYMIYEKYNQFLFFNSLMKDLVLLSILN